MRALIVDDDISLSRIFSRCLTQWGWSADECRSVSGALALFRGTPYDLALCEIDLPDGDGVCLAEALVKVRPSLQVIMVSGDARNLYRARQAGLQRCLRKPFNLDDLQVLVRQPGEDSPALQDGPPEVDRDRRAC